jgi:hypothetical protein
MHSNEIIHRWAIFSFTVLVGSAWLAEAAGLTLDREGQWLIIGGDQIPGRQIRINYL